MVYNAQRQGNKGVDQDPSKRKIILEADGAVRTEEETISVKGFKTAAGLREVEHSVAFAGHPGQKVNTIGQDAYVPVHSGYKRKSRKAGS
jgi:hypothetical protein